MGRLVEEDSLLLMKEGYNRSSEMFLREMFVKEPQITTKSSNWWCKLQMTRWNGEAFLL
jgi:hypothetical protein